MPGSDKSLVSALTKPENKKIDRIDISNIFLNMFLN